MSDFHQTILYALKSFKVAIALDIGDKIIILNPRILEKLDIEDVAVALSASNLSDAEILRSLEVIDTARKPPFARNKSNQKPL